MQKYIIISGLALIILIIAILINQPHSLTDRKILQKIEIDLNQLDDQGLRGDADGKVAVSYEFAIPDSEECRTRVQAIDSTVQFMPGSSGRIGAGKHQCLCIGSTHQPNFRAVLYSLAELPFIDRIIVCDFE